jgi:hypothetical protein
VIFLTDDPLYWGRNRQNADAEYEELRIHEERRVKGLCALSWKGGAINIEGGYMLHWRDLPDSSVPSEGPFRYLITAVPKLNCRAAARQASGDTLKI